MGFRGIRGGTVNRKLLILLAFALLLPLGYLSATVETTTVQGKILTPSGAVATGGKVVAVLSAPGTSPDLSTAASQRIGGRVEGAIDPNGDVTGVVLVPNDAITPSGTYYIVQITTTTPTRTSWTEQWSVTTSPDPVDVGAITRLAVPPGLTFDLDSLSDVSVASPADLELLQYQTATSKWTNTPPATVLGAASLAPDVQGDWSFSGQLKLPNSATVPTADCDAAGEAGRTYYDLDAPLGQQLYVCSGATGWVLAGGTEPADCALPTVFCGGPGWEYPEVCGMHRGSAGTYNCGVLADDCDPNSAMGAAATYRASDPNTFVTVKASPGTHEECVAVNFSHVALVGAGPRLTHFQVYAQDSALTDVRGGVVRIANNATRASITDPIPVFDVWLSGFSVEGGGWTPPNTCLQIGPASGPGSNTPAAFDEVHTDSVWLACPHDGYQVYASRYPNDPALPRTYLTNSFVAGGDAVAFKGKSRSVVQNTLVYATTNFCESTDTANLAQRTGTVRQNASDATTVYLAVTEDFPNGSFAGRDITLTDNGGGCPVVGTYQIGGWDNATQTATLAEPNGSAATTACDYSIAAVKHDDGTDYVAGDPVDHVCPSGVDWSFIRDLSAGANPCWKNTCFHFSFGTEASNGNAVYDLFSNKCEIFINDWGSCPSSSGTQQSYTAPLLIYDGIRDRINVDGLRADVRLNTDQIDSTGGETERVAGIAFTNGTVSTTKITNSSIHIENRAETDNVDCVLATAPDPNSNLILDGLDCEVNNYVGYPGTSTTIYQGGASYAGVTVGRFTSNTTPTISGQISLLHGASWTGSGTIDFGVTAANTCTETDNAAAAATVTVPGAQIGDPCIVGTPAAAASVAASYTCRISAANTATIKLCVDSSGPVDPGSGSFVASTRRP